MSLEKINRIEGLKFLAGSLDTQDEFTAEYQEMLEEFQADQDMIRIMKTILMHQVAFLVNAQIQMIIEDKQDNPEPVAQWNV